MPEEILRTLHQHQRTESRHSVELCVKCPLEGAYVPVIGNCVQSQVTEDGRKTDSSVKLHAQADDPWYELEQHCPHIQITTSKPISGDLTNIICIYKVK